ncbi:hypothetical protein K493DRAFT_309881 [Basidiobolus meristosporus CBS 931.73]|uniref:RRM domain-containing protein n=1 Tax=Basidiobolus meristosporus CBS 931.73 TaxID=1314790 RepID=A0A1Y1ZDC1_9FUNG|nr:hypothetical protein K493DRAFT_309881 [Basidiobolus meristosporus CBS 931.73]|eukprot:ORY08283.1 hypothetical protein K493DRAFT_309881 [Basidiobolus meristosporus CBS 931.73]
MQAIRAITRLSTKSTLARPGAQVMLVRGFRSSLFNRESEPMAPAQVKKDWSKPEDKLEINISPEEFRKANVRGTPSNILAIKNLPLYTTQADIMNFITSVQHVDAESVKTMIFYRSSAGVLNGTCFVEFAKGSDAQVVAMANKKRMLDGRNITVEFTDKLPYRSRFIGSASGRAVVFSGLPVLFPVPEVKELLRGFKIAVDSTERPIESVPVPRNGLSGMIFVKMINEAEAHRVVRKFHNTSFKYNNTNYTIKAQVAY